MQVHERDIGGIVCLDVEGRLVIPIEDGRIVDRVKSLLHDGQRQILLNLKDVTQIDTTGLATLTTVRRVAEQARAAIKLACLPPRVHDLLVVTRLISLFEVFDSEAEAVRSFGDQCV